MTNNLTSRDPFGGLARFDPFTDIDDIVRDFFSPLSLRHRDVAARMRVDISETEQSYQVNAEIPGVSKEDIKVSIDGHRVSISAEVKEERRSDDGAGKSVRSERIYGQQYRNFTLPQEVDDGAAQARYQDGILELTLPKKAGSGGKQLTIQ
ncbi:Hsp20/alpha crystallin family protein [Janthinobacterium agaricidamnosum]|uniref:Hsp20/alpha crystallin family protein n=1 Tax=Janthinobacterium agaricidamnosum NBRC 102515 = DSM 9628 TaxID=1349767 RepID=W0V675_9BURK|nr:Hsp20/alpha crystallin family protein [Janthinobacterium agaricidamnosum]CDG83095.1 hsp20/alpha crystallin family protein [Janthinobacterium agaricidamnosum NBRC 102515 = DSM 9628]